MTQKTPDFSNVEETRIALAFSGGVALAVYESGVALEFFRLVSGDPIYKELSDQVGRIVVDVITGTSAGGLNGAFLANALVNQGDIEQILTLWRNEADFDKLLHGLFASNPDSLLNGDYFHDQLFQALSTKRSAQTGPPAFQDSIDLYITATNLDGDRIIVTTQDGDQIPTRTHRQVFHFRYREGEPNDFSESDCIKRLALAARTTASFPFAFEPMLVEKSLMGSVATNLEESAYHIDGGVLDNEPIALALQGIDQRTADRRITRRLFYIEPDPELISARGAQREAARHSAPEVIFKALVGLPSYQSITNSLQDIQKRNKTVEERRRTLDYFETAAGIYQSTKCSRKSMPDDSSLDLVRQIEQDVPVGEIQDGLKFVGPERNDSAFYRAIEDGYLDLRLKRVVSAELRSCFEEFLHVLKEALENEEADRQAEMQAHSDDRKKRKAKTDDASNEGWPLRSRLFLIKSTILAHLDLQYYQRYYHYLMGRVQQLYPKRSMGTGSITSSGTGDGGDEWNLYVDAAKRLNEVTKHFCTQLLNVQELEKIEAGRLKAAHVHLEGQMRSTLEKLRASKREQDTQLQGSDRQKKEPTSSCVKLLNELLETTKALPLHVERCELFNKLRLNDGLVLKNAVLEVLQKYPKQEPDKGERVSPAQEYCDLLIKGYWQIRDALQSFYLRDMMLFPMMAGPDIQEELATVQFARLSPNDANLYIPGLTAMDKLAGETLWHFGGFLKKSWRCNDLTWGRLDAAEIIVRKLLTPDKWKTDGIRIVKALHDNIIAEMTRRDMSIFEPANETANKNLIGRQTMKVIPISDRIRWFLQSAVTTGKILRKGVEESRAAPPLRRLVTGLSWAINGLTLVAIVVTIISKHLCSWKTLKFFLIMLAIAGIMGLGALLWNNSPNELLNTPASSWRFLRD
jgi:predicted acylesterase/phospholipase RssA